MRPYASLNMLPFFLNRCCVSFNNFSHEYNMMLSDRCVVLHKSNVAFTFKQLRGKVIVLKL